MAEHTREEDHPDVVQGPAQDGCLDCEECGHPTSSDYVVADRTGQRLCIECERKSHGRRR